MAVCSRWEVNASIPDLTDCLLYYKRPSTHLTGRRPTDIGLPGGGFVFVQTSEDTTFHGGSLFAVVFAFFVG